MPDHLEAQLFGVEWWGAVGRGAGQVSWCSEERRHRGGGEATRQRKVGRAFFVAYMQKTRTCTPTHPRRAHQALRQRLLTDLQLPSVQAQQARLSVHGFFAALISVGQGAGDGGVGVGWTGQSRVKTERKRKQNMNLIKPSPHR